IQTRLQSVLMRLAQQRRFIVVAGVSGKIGQRIQRKERLRLWAHRNWPGKRGTRGRVASREWLALCIRLAAQIASPLSAGRHQPRARARGSIARPLISDKEVGAAVEKRRNPYRPAEGRDHRNAVVAVLWQHKSGQRIRLRIKD